MSEAHLNINLKPVDDANPVPVKLIGGTSSNGGGGGSGIIGVDTEGTKWLLVANTSATPATITYYKVSDGTVGTPSGGFTPDADQNGLTDTQLRASAVPVSATSLPLPAGAATDASLGTDGTTPPTIAGTGVRGWLRGIYEKLTGTLTVTGPLTDTQLRASAVVVSANNNVLQSVNNTSTAQLAAAATFTGTWDSGDALLAESAQLMVTSDQTGTLYIDQSQDTAGSVGVQTKSYAITAGVAFNTAIGVIGKALRVRFTNNGSAATTTFAISTIFTPIMSVLPTALTQKGSLRTANQENVSVTLTQNVKSLTASTSTELVAANSSRQYLAIQVIGTSGINLNIGADATVNSGWAISPASATGGQGGAMTWDAGVVTQQQIKAISAAATTVVVWEGI
jgi:hypothetical protein